jgi:hypothetical protein
MYKILSVDNVFGHVSLDAYLGVSEIWIGRWKSGDWLSKELPEKQQDAAKSKGGGRSMLMQLIADADRW